jgi:predicted transcriptional regulator
MIKNDLNTPTRVVTAHLPSELVGQLDELSNRLERSKAWVIKEALTAWVALEKKRYQLTLEAISDAKAGKVVSHSKIKNWADNLNKLQ